MPVGLDSERVPIVPKHDIGWYFYSAPPGAGENVVLWGHVLRFRDAPEIPAPFARLHELQPGATIALYNEAGQMFTYALPSSCGLRRIRSASYSHRARATHAGLVHR